MAKMILTVVIGYLLGSNFSHLIVSFEHWIAFVLLLIIGGMIFNSLLTMKQ